MKNLRTASRSMISYCENPPRWRHLGGIRWKAKIFAPEITQVQLLYYKLIVVINIAINEIEFFNTKNEIMVMTTSGFDLIYEAYETFFDILDIERVKVIKVFVQMAFSNHQTPKGRILEYFNHTRKTYRTSYPRTGQTSDYYWLKVNFDRSDQAVRLPRDNRY